MFAKQKQEESSSSISATTVDRRIAVPVLVLTIIVSFYGCREDSERDQDDCIDGTLDCPCDEDDKCNEDLECNDDGMCVSTGASDGDTDADTDSDADGDADDETCKHYCQEHCESIGGNVMDGTCDDSDLQCCDTQAGGDGDADGDSDGDSDIGDKFVGNIPTHGSVRSDFMQYWDQITPENVGKWGSVEWGRDSYNWSSLEAVYNFAKKNNIPFKQHTMVWGSQYPSWINNLSASEQAEEIEEWIRDYCNKFPDTEMMDVVNEPIEGHAPAKFAQNAFGDDWIIKSFELAHQYCPNTVLILNDYNVLRWNTDQFIAIAEPGISAGVIDAVGCQAHSLGGHDGQPIQNISELSSNLDRIAALGVPVYISEYDIEQTNDDAQLQVMKDQFTLFYEHPKVVGITLWGYIVDATWRTGTGLKHSNGTHRPALDWLMDYLDR